MPINKMCPICTIPMDVCEEESYMGEAYRCKNCWFFAYFDKFDENGVFNDDKDPF